MTDDEYKQLKAIARAAKDVVLSANSHYCEGAIEQVEPEAMEELRTAVAQAPPEGFDFQGHLRRQYVWSEQTFGPGQRTAGLLQHIRKELCEIENDPSDLEEWIDVIILALEGAWRAGHSPEEIVTQLVAKQAKNEARSWPDWRTAPEDQPIEHIRSPRENNEGNTTED